MLTPDALFAPLKDIIGKDYESYRNHVYRVLTYVMHFLQGDETYRPAIEIALVYHDIGLWTDRALAYLEPSEAIAERDNQANGWEIDSELLRNLIHWHHKIFPYRGPDEAAVNALRRGDWVDASQGTIRKGLAPEQIAEVYAAISVNGFYDTLERLAAELNNGNKLGGILKVMRGIMKW